MAAQPSIKQLKYLVALAETGHFGRAAEACFITQPSLSAAISELENLLGAQLVERNKRQVLITALGQEVVSRARHILREVDELAIVAHAANQPLVGPINIGVIPTIGPYLLPDVMARLRSGFPKMQPFLREDQTAKLVDLLLAGKLDLALIALPIEENGLEFAGMVPEDDVLYDYDSAGTATIELPEDNIAQQAAFKIFDNILN